MKGTGVDNLNLNNLGSSSVGVPASAPPICKGTVCKGESTASIGSSYHEDTTEKVALDACKEKVEANSKKVGNCILDTTESCRGVPGCVAVVGSRDQSSKVCQITKCTNDIEDNRYGNRTRCIYQYKNGVKQLPGTCAPVSKDIPFGGPGWRSGTDPRHPWVCESKDGTDSATVTCSMEKRR